MAQNPYEPPKAPIAAGPISAAGDVCPKCKSTSVNAPKFTWWGGALGPRMLSHRVCNGCGFGHNARTGRSNTTAIVIYQVVLFVIAFAIFFALRS